MPKHDVDFDVRDGSQVAAEQLVDEGAVHLVCPGWLTVNADTILASKTTKGVPVHAGAVRPLYRVHQVSQRLPLLVR